jgi:hypothetical protein
MHAFGLCWKAEGLIFSVYWRGGDTHATLKVRRVKSSRIIVSNTTEGIVEAAKNV